MDEKGWIADNSTHSMTIRFFYGAGGAYHFSSSHLQTSNQSTMNSHSCAFFRAPEKVFDPSNWDPLIEKVLGRLERSVRDTPIKPDGQDRCFG